MRKFHLKALFLGSLVTLDACGLVLAFQTAFWVRFYEPFFLRFFPVTKGIPERMLYNQTLLALLPVWLLVFFYGGLYRETFLSAYDEFIQVVRGVILCSLLTTAMTFAIRGIEYSRLMIGLWALFSITLLYSLRELAKWLFRQLQYRTRGPENILVVGHGKAVEAIRDMALQQPLVRISVLESLSALRTLEKDLHAKHISEILLVQASLEPQDILAASQICERFDIECKIIPDLLEMRRGEIIMDGFFGLPIFQVKPLSLHGANYLLKRSFDITVSFLILSVIFAPLLLIGILIRLDSPGPVLFSQDRMGLRGRKFKLYKFRTMIANADRHLEKLKHLSERAGPVFKMKNDPRITRVGRWLRRFSLDELPQILNVIKGDMSLVGPRPQVLWEAAFYDETAKKRLRIMPGITGLWQVSGRAALSFEEMINLDIYYLEHWSLGLDLKILLRTLPAVFAKEGAY